jgi:hypothetical protein
MKYNITYIQTITVSKTKTYGNDLEKKASVRVKKKKAKMQNTMKKTCIIPLNNLVLIKLE